MKSVIGYGLLLVAAGGLGYWLFAQLSLVDPAAKVRRQYRATHQGKVENLLGIDRIKPGALVTSPSVQVETSAQGNVLSVVPPEIAAAKKEAPVEPKPVVQVPSDPPKVSLDSLIPPPANLPVDLPPVPLRLLDQSPPSVRTLANAAPVATQIRVAPRRYLFNNLAPETMLGKTVQVRPDDQLDFNPETFSPMGEDITLALTNNVASNSFEVPVSAAVWEPFYFQGHRLLQIGDRIVGYAQAGKNRDRILVTFSKIILKDGRSIPLQATALDRDGTVGVKGFTIGENLLKTLTPVLLEAVRGFGEVFQNRTETTSSSFLGTAHETTLGNDLGTKGVEAGRGALTKVSEIIAQDLEENRPYVLAIAGTVCRARLLQPLDISLADYGK